MLPSDHQLAVDEVDEERPNQPEERSHAAPTHKLPERQRCEGSARAANCCPWAAVGEPADAAQIVPASEVRERRTPQAVARTKARADAGGTVREHNNTAIIALTMLLAAESLRLRCPGGSEGVPIRSPPITERHPDDPPLAPWHLSALVPLYPTADVARLLRP